MKLSIITVNFNDAEGLERTIKSVISQTFRDYEFIIIDGGSTDGSVGVIKQYESYIDYWVSEPDGGIYSGMNKGLRQAKGDYVNFMNGGDCYHSEDVLEKIFAFNSKADIITGEHSENGARNIGKDGVTMLDLYKWSIDHQASFIRRDVALRHPYDEKYRIVSDWKFFIEKIIFQNCSFEFMPVTVAVFEGGGISEAQKERNESERKDVLEKFFPPRVLQDYEHFKGKESPMLDLIPQFNHTYRLEKFIIWVVKTILRIYHIFK